MHEIFFYHLGKFIMQGALQVGVDHSLLGYIFLQIMIDEFGVKLCPDSCQRFSLRLRNTEPLEGALNILRHLLPASLHPGLMSDIGGNVIHIQTFNRRSPVRNLKLMIEPQRLQTKIQHPCRIVLFRRYPSDNLLCQSLFFSEIIRTVLFIFKII